MNDKNTFQWDAYRPLVDVFRGGGVCPTGEGLPNWGRDGVCIAGGLPNWRDLHPGGSVHSPGLPTAGVCIQGGLIRGQHLAVCPRGSA